MTRGEGCSSSTAAGILTLVAAITREAQIPSLLLCFTQARILFFLLPLNNFRLLIFLPSLVKEMFGIFSKIPPFFDFLYQESLSPFQINLRICCPATQRLEGVTPSEAQGSIYWMWEGCSFTIFPFLVKHVSSDLARTWMWSIPLLRDCKHLKTRKSERLGCY